MDKGCFRFFAGKELANLGYTKPRQQLLSRQEFTEEHLHCLTKQIVQGTILLLNSRTESEWKVINANLAAPSSPSPEAIASRKVAMTAFKTRLQKLATSTPRPIYWVVGPCTRFWHSRYNREREVDEFCSWLETLPNQKVLNLYTLDYPDAFFTDPTHLNYTGATNFTTLIKTRLPNLLK